MNEEELFQGDDYAPKEPSPREKAARQMHAVLKEYKLAATEPQRAEDRRRWVMHLKPDGAMASVEVFSESYIRVSWSFDGGLPAARIFMTDIEACGFIVAAFVNRDMALALSIPTKPPGRKKEQAMPQTRFPFNG